VTARYWRTVWPDGSSTVKYWTFAEAVSSASQMRVAPGVPKPKVKLFRREDGAAGETVRRPPTMVLSRA